MVPLVPPRSGCPVPPGPPHPITPAWIQAQCVDCRPRPRRWVRAVDPPNCPFEATRELENRAVRGDSHGIRQKPYVFPPEHREFFEEFQNLTKKHPQAASRFVLADLRYDLKLWIGCLLESATYPP